MIYVASPYTHPHPVVVWSRVHGVKVYVARLIRQGIPAFSPIVYAHDLAGAHGLPTSTAFWMPFCLDFLMHCEYMQVLKLSGWEESKGIALEVQFANQRGITIRYIEP